MPSLSSVAPPLSADALLLSAAALPFLFGEIPPKESEDTGDRRCPQSWEWASGLSPTHDVFPAGSRPQAWYLLMRYELVRGDGDDGEAAVQDAGGGGVDAAERAVDVTEATRVKAWTAVGDYDDDDDDTLNG
eukprot:m.89378 g.89378  ORF g.89378 m.89378 type:complete len:132 (+) comp14575_c0_seq4:3494-3889(+)